jgi:CRP-like cAMP-binding protein
MTQPIPHSSNRVLASLAEDDLETLLPHLRPIDLPLGRVLFATGDTISSVYFPHAGVVSLVVELTTGEMIEAAMIGREGLVGGVSALDNKISTTRAIIQVAGSGSVIDVEPSGSSR